MNTQALVHQAALLNREGIAALACGYGEKAHAYFKTVLEIMGYITQMPDLAAATAANNNNNNSSKAGILACLSPVPIANLQCDRFFIYENAFLFQPDQHHHHQQQQQQPTHSTNYSQRDITMLSAAAIFNMALTYHQRAIMGRPSQGVLRIAARMYDQCLQVVVGLPAATAAARGAAAAVEEEAANEEEINVLKMIILNNRSHIAYELDEYDQAQEALGKVHKLSRRIARHTQEVAATAATTTTTPPLTNVLQEDAFDEIALNVLVTTRPVTAPCA